MWLYAQGLGLWCWTWQTSIGTPICLRYCRLYVVQMGETVLQFTVLPFRLSTALCTFTKLTRPLAQALSTLGVEVHRDITLAHASQMGSLLSLTKFHLTFTQMTVWLEME